MVSPLLPQLFSGQALRNWLRTDGAGIFRAFESGAEALRYVRANLGAIRTQDFYDIRREVRSIPASANQLRDYPGNQLVPLAWHNTEHNLHLSTEYQYRIELFGYDPNTGILKSQYMTVASDRQLTPDQVQDVARSYVGEGGESGDIVISTFGTLQPMRRS